MTAHELLHITKHSLNTLPGFGLKTPMLKVGKFMLEYQVMLQIRDNLGSLWVGQGVWSICLPSVLSASQCLPPPFIYKFYVSAYIFIVGRIAKGSKVRN